MRLHPSAAAWAELTTRLHDFAYACFLEHTGAFLLVAFTNCDRLFEDFARRARVVFNDARPPLFQVAAPMSLVRAADAMLVKWRDFIQGFALLRRAGAPPIYALLAGRLAAALQVTDALLALFSAPQPLVAIGPVRKVKAAIEALRIEIAALEARARLIGARTARPGAFQEKLEPVVAGLRGLFFDVIPNNSMIVSEIPVLKRELSSICDEIERVNGGITRFYDLARSVGRAIDGAGEALEGLFQALSIKPHVVVMPPLAEEVEEKPEDLQPKPVPQRKMDALAVDSCKRMQESIGELKSALDGTRALFVSKT
jgi:hypothetical protein